MTKTTHIIHEANEAMAKRMRSLDFPDHIIEDLLGVKMAPTVVEVVDDADTDVTEEALESDATVEEEAISV